MNAKIKLILSGLLITLNLAALGLGSYWAYISTLGYESPVITEQSLRAQDNRKEQFEFK